MAGDGWTEWSKHVLKELERLNDNHEVLRGKMEEIQHSMITDRPDNSTIEAITAWKNKISDVTSPTQLKEMQQTVADLEKFKVRATTVFIVLQTLFGATIAALALL